MASNFKIHLHRRNREVHINLKGDFDGSSACVLFNALKSDCGNKDEIFIHTNGLGQVFPFGRGVLNANFSRLKNKWSNINFTGEKAHQIAPEKSMCA